MYKSLIENLHDPILADAEQWRCLPSVTVCNVNSSFFLHTFSDNKVCIKYAQLHTKLCVMVQLTSQIYHCDKM